MKLKTHCVSVIIAIKIVLLNKELNFYMHLIIRKLHV